MTHSIVSPAYLFRNVDGHAVLLTRAHLFWSEFDDLQRSLKMLGHLFLGRDWGFTQGVKNGNNERLDVLGAVILNTGRNLIENDWRWLSVENHADTGHSDLWLLTLV